MSSNTLSNLSGPVLLVNASNEALSSLEQIFHAIGLETYTASDTKGALTLYNKLRKAHRHPQIAIIDATISTGKDSGFDLARSIHDLDKGKYTTTFIYTGSEPFLAAMLALDANVESVISKSVVGPSLIDEIEKALEKKARRELRARDAGQAGRWNFTDREMIRYVLNLIFIVALTWFVGHIDQKVSDVAAQMSTESAFRIADDGKIMRIQGTVDAMTKEAK
jgi:DNA-binding NtrC family response regulator